MKILIICDNYPPFAYGGAGIIARSIVRGMKLRGYETNVVCNYRDLRQIPDEYGVYRILTPKNKWLNSKLIKFCYFYFRDKFLLKKIIKQYRPEIIYNLNQWGISIPIISWINNLKIPKVYRFGDEWLGLHYYNKKSNKYDFLFSTKEKLESDSIVVNSFDLKKRINNLINGEITVIRNGVDLNIFTYSRKPLTLKREIKLIYVGRIVRHKETHILLKVLKLLIEEFNNLNFSLTLLGSWPQPEYKKEILEYIRKHSLEKKVKILKFKNQKFVAKILHKNNIFLFPSPPRNLNKTVEGCPSALLEAWACGVPVIARMAHGHGELLKNGVNVLTIENGNPEDYVEKIRTLLTDESLRKKISEEGKTMIEKNFSFNDMINKTEKIFNKHVVKNT